MHVLTALYELKDKSASLGEDDRAFVFETIAVHEGGTRQLNRQEVLRIEGIGRNARGVKAACAHLSTAPVFENGEETNERECLACGYRLKIR